MSDPKLGLVSAGKTRDPPYAADTRNRGWVFTIDLARVRQSDTWSLCAAEFRPWLLWLWIKSWDEIPIGSYPNDDSIIAAKIGMTLELFDGHRSMLMRGWYRANDNRLYHPYISELVLNRILWKEAERVRKAAWREHLSHDVPRDTASVPRDCDGTGSGSGSGSKSKVKSKVKNKGAVAASPLPFWLPPNLWQAWVDHRKALRKPMTPHAALLGVAKLDKLREGSDPTALVEHAIELGWTTFWPIKGKQTGPHAAKREPTLAERRAANMAEITGRNRNGRTIDVEPNSRETVRPALGDLREPDDDDVGGLPKG